MFTIVFIKKFYKYNSKNINIVDFKINQFSSLSNSLDDSLIFLNKSIYYNIKDIKGVCITKVPLQEYNLKKNIDFVVLKENIFLINNFDLDLTNEALKKFDAKTSNLKIQFVKKKGK